MPSKLNTCLLKELSEQLQEAPYGIFVDYAGLSAREAHELRGRLLKDALRLKVARNRIVRLVLEPSGGKGIGRLLKGQIAIIYGRDDPVVAAKTVLDCVKASGKIKIRGAFLEGHALSPEQVDLLAKMPSKKELLGQILGAITGPATALATGFDGLFRSLDFGGVARELGGLLDAHHLKMKQAEGPK